jgi:hypothetical protein
MISLLNVDGRHAWAFLPRISLIFTNSRTVFVIIRAIRGKISLSTLEGETTNIDGWEFLQPPAIARP